MTLNAIGEHGAELTVFFFDIPVHSHIATLVKPLSLKSSKSRQVTLNHGLVIMKR